MDCEKFESNLIDELYGELDDVTSAAMKRHAGGCSRCAGLLGGLRATRKVAALPLDPLPDGLEERVLAAAREAQKVVPMRSRLSQVVSRAGAWAMRPQTAMAAVFLLAIGSSVVLMNSRSHDEQAPASVAVQTKGAPVDMPELESAPPTAYDRGDNAAHGTLGPVGRGRTGTTLAAGDDLTKDKFDLDEAKKESSDPSTIGDGTRLLANAAAPAGAAEVNAAPAVGGASNGSGSGGGYFAGQGQAQQAYAPGGGTAFQTAMDDYRAMKYDEATRRFDTLSSNDSNAALWAARSVRESNGCAAAVGRFDQVAARSPDSPTGWEATLDAGRCYKSLGNYDAARARFAKLAGVPTYAARAQTELDTMAPASARAATKAASPSPMRPAATATAPAGKPTTKPGVDANGL
ncbi:hypothetical protein BH09MYX1_BH09MYX1_19950 [soil metagenome]